ncbi:MAG: cellulase family glycosylhydrolase [Anaerolineales bacterium]|nr:cellulase family glycosylhydrolase [Anaerolineales bacterium]
MSTALRLHPSNPKLFDYHGRPLVLLTATEHYGAVMNRPFQFERYLADLAARGLTLTRLFALFRELQSPINPYSTCKPETPDYLAPFRRTGPGRALDLEPKYDLDQPNPEYFERLHRFLTLAQDYGVIVELVLLSNTYLPAVWELNPLHSHNNVNGLEDAPWPDYMSRRHPARFARQGAHVRRLVTETNGYDNLIYEICNEPGGNAPVPGSPSLAEVNDWLAALIAVVRETEARLPNQHLLAGQEAFTYEPWQQPSDLTFAGLDYDIVNLHPLPNTTYAGHRYDLGGFMSKQLKLRALRDCGYALYAAPKPLNQDEDNVASQYKDLDGWTIHRKRAWTVLLTGGHYDYIDFSIINGAETGTAASKTAVRSWFQHLAGFIHSFDLARAHPLPGLVTAAPPHALPVAFGVPGEDLAVYLADERELAAARDLPDGDLLDRGAGQPISGALTLALPAGDYALTVFDPQTGQATPAPRLTSSGAPLTLPVGPFVHDTVLRLRRT